MKKLAIVAVTSTLLISNQASATDDQIDFSNFRYLGQQSFRMNSVDHNFRQRNGRVTRNQTNVHQNINRTYQFYLDEANSRVYTVENGRVVEVRESDPGSATIPAVLALPNTRQPMVAADMAQRIRQRAEAVAARVLARAPQAATPTPTTQATLPADFRPQAYLDLNPDLQEATANMRLGHRLTFAMNHYLAHGIQEGRRYVATALPAGFNGLRYIEIHPDLIAATAAMTSQQKEEFASNHYLNHGITEQRRYN